jgi:tetratricopeptide (TPR) repeat protein
VISKLLAGVCVSCALLWAQSPAPPSWQDQVRKFAAAQDWPAALQTVDQEIARRPQDTDVRSWRARVLTWSGRLAEAEHEYNTILSLSPNDPDNWAGLASVYSRSGRNREAIQALEHAVALDARRADLHTALGLARRRAGEQKEAKIQFQQALALDPVNPDARAGLQSLRGEPRHELRIGVNTDLFNFADANHDEAAALTSRWTPRWQTHFEEGSYQRSGSNAARFTAGVTQTSSRWGALTVGGAAAHDLGIVPKSEAFFDYDHGWKLSHQAFVRGLEISYGQHWYWYSTARILTLNQTTLLYLPGEWTWALRLTGARSDFSATGAEWRPSGMTRLGFPLTARNRHSLDGNVFFAAGTENFAQVDQIGRFSSQTYGGGLRFKLTPLQDVTGVAAYQKRTQDRTQMSFGFTYGIRF